VPDLQGDTVDQAVDELAAAGLNLGSVGSAIDDLCNFINEVMGQSPAAGTVVPVGASVSVTIGELPAHPCP
jgi:beta-lactam-binding protein with PASTA domain